MKATFGLEFEEFLETLMLRMRTDTMRQRFTYYCLKVVYALLGVVLIGLSALLIWLDWRRPGASIADKIFLLGFGIYLLLCPYLYRRTIRRIYVRQKLAEEGTIELTEHGLFATCPGRSEGKIEWSAFDRSIESRRQFILVMGYAAIAVPKRVLTPESEAELRQLVRENIKQIWWH